MSAGVWFWIIYVICLVFGAWCHYPLSESNRQSAGVSLVVFVLLGLLGWGVFGPPLK